MLIEHGWPYYIEWYPRECDVHAARAILSGDTRECAELAGGHREPLHSLLIAVAEGRDPAACVIAAWDYACPEHVLGYDTADVLRQLRELV